MVTYKFSRALRLLTPREFQIVFESPTRFSSQHFTVLIRPNNLTHPRLGFAIAKKRIKLAVERNRLKRFARETFRLQQYNLPAIDIVFMAKSGADQLTNHELEQQLNKLWRKIIRRHA
jgi:ribonuclease P protein component